MGRLADWKAFSIELAPQAVRSESGAPAKQQVHDWLASQFASGHLAPALRQLVVRPARSEQMELPFGALGANANAKCCAAHLLERRGRLLAEFVSLSLA